MKRLRNLIARFIVRAVVEDFRANGRIRQMILDAQSEGR